MKLRINRSKRKKQSRWDDIKALRVPEPVVVKRADLQLVRDRAGNVVGSVNRAYRRSVQGRRRGVPVVTSSPRAARIIAVDPDGRASTIRASRVARRAAREVSA